MEKVWEYIDLKDKVSAKGIFIGHWSQHGAYIQIVLF